MRKDYIDAAKGIGIFFCLMGHVCDNHGILGPINYFITSFNMPLFFITFGMVAYKDPLLDLKTTFSRRIRGLIVPYFLWAFIYCSGYHAKTWLYICYGSNFSLGAASSNAMLWFLPTMFVCSILTYFCIRVKEKFRSLFYLSPVLLFMGGGIIGKYNHFNLHLPMSFDVAMVASGFSILGYMFKNYMDALGQKVKLSGPLLLTAGIGVLAANWIGQRNGWAVMALHRYGNHILLFLSGAILMCGCILVLCKAVCRFMPCGAKMLTYIGRHSLTFYAYQNIAFIFTNAILAALGETGITTAYGIMEITRDTIISLVVTLPISFLIEKYAPVLEGK